MEDARYNKNVVYENYKPRHLRAMEEYMDFVLARHEREGKVCTTGSLGAELKAYYNAEVRSQLPAQVAQILNV